MSALANLKLVSAKRSAGLTPIALRRIKVANRIVEQIELAKAIQSGSTYQSTKQRKVADPETGAIKSVSVPKRVRPWSFNSESGKTCLSLFYGSKVVEISKGKTAVELANANDLPKVLSTLLQAVQAGELDDQLEAASKSVRSNFRK